MTDFDREASARRKALLQEGTAAAMAGDLATGRRILVGQFGMPEASVTWLADNAESIKASNAWVETHGLLLAEYRMF